jgi:signal transduction histidine kinase/HAMP domain-containing protein
MRLAQRLLLGALLSIGILVALVVTVIDGRMRQRLREDAAAELEREARLVAAQWADAAARRVDADSVANVAGAALGHRVTLVRDDGVVIGDSEFDGPALTRLENHRGRPEVASAMRAGRGSSRRASASAGDEELYVAVRAPLGVARVSVATRSLEELFARVQRDVLLAALGTGLIAMLVSALLARAVARPLAELTGVARSLAAGDLSRRPAHAAPGEVGELGDAMQRLAEQLQTRIAALGDEEALLAAISESLNEGVVAIDARQWVMRINQRARELLGVRSDVPFPAEHLPRERVLRDALAAAERGEPSEALELSLAGRTVALTARPLAGGRTVLALFDVTPLRRLEIVRRDFVANVSHELRTPLTVVGGFAETLLDDGLPAADRHRFTETIVASTRRMQRIVDDLLDLSRIESGGWVPAPSPCDVRAAAAEVIEATRDRAASLDVVVDQEIAPDATTVIVDPTALRQVLANLVDNAIRHAPSGRVTVFARREGEAALVGVRDTGVGIAAEHLPRIFERFYRVDAGRSRAEGGTGLGLAIVRHLVEAHGGRVRVESAPGRGTTIWAELPQRAWRAERAHTEHRA